MAEYIEKQAAIDAVHGEFDECLVWDESGLDTANVVENVLYAIPPAYVRPVAHGRWLDYDDDYGAYCCSVCEQDAPEDTKWPYCPHCGADMRETKD